MYCSVYFIQVDVCVSQPPRSCVTLALQQTTFLCHFHFCRKLLPSVPVCLKVLLQFAARANSLTFNLYTYLCIYLFAHVQPNVFIDFYAAFRDIADHIVYIKLLLFVWRQNMFNLLLMNVKK